MLIEFRCPQCKAALKLDPALPGKCSACNESFAGDFTYQSDLAVITQCAVCRSPRIQKQRWSQRYLGSGSTLIVFLLIIPTRGWSLILPLFTRLLLDNILPGTMRCLNCGCIHTKGSL